MLYKDKSFSVLEYFKQETKNYASFVFLMTILEFFVFLMLPKTMFQNSLGPSNS